MPRYHRPMPPPVIHREIEVVIGNPTQVARSIEAAFAAQDVAAVCKVDERVVKIDVSTLDLKDEHLDERTEALIDQAASDVVATIEWREAT
jgi:hypothetical protein